MNLTRSAIRLTDTGARVLLEAGIEHARAMGVPQCISIVDEGCNLVAFIRMDGARILSIPSSQRKAMTAATTGKPTGGIDPSIELKLAIATDGDMVNLRGGLPIIVRRPGDRRDRRRFGTRRSGSRGSERRAGKICRRTHVLIRSRLHQNLKSRSNAHFFASTTCLLSATAPRNRQTVSPQSKPSDVQSKPILPDALKRWRTDSSEGPMNRLAAAILVASIWRYFGLHFGPWQPISPCGTYTKARSMWIPPTTGPASMSVSMAAIAGAMRRTRSPPRSGGCGFAAYGWLGIRRTDRLQLAVQPELGVRSRR